jgi:hypothetical protein
VVNLFSGCQLVLLLALLTEWIRFYIAVTDSFPGPAVSFVGSRVAFVLVVLFVHYLLMLGTVLLAYSKPTAAGVGTGTLGFVWHWFASFRAYKKPPQDFSRGGLFLYFLYYQYTVPG